MNYNCQSQPYLVVFIEVSEPMTAGDVLPSLPRGNFCDFQPARAQVKFLLLTAQSFQTTMNA